MFEKFLRERVTFSHEKAFTDPGERQAFKICGVLRNRRDREVNAAVFQHSLDRFRLGKDDIETHPRRLLLKQPERRGNKCHKAIIRGHDAEGFPEGRGVKLLRSHQTGETREQRLKLIRERVHPVRRIKLVARADKKLIPKILSCLGELPGCGGNRETAFLCGVRK